MRFTILTNINRGNQSRVFFRVKHVTNPVTRRITTYTAAREEMV